MKHPSESEIYYARKNRRREWLGRHWFKFLWYPFVVLSCLLCLFGAFYLLSLWGFQIGKRYDMQHNPQDWQHWHWHYHTNFYSTNIYNRS